MWRMTATTFIAPILLVAATIAIPHTGQKSRQNGSKPIPPAIVSRKDSLDRHLVASARAKLVRAGAAMAKNFSPKDPVQQAKGVASKAFTGIGKLPPVEIEVIAFLVLEQATDDTESDLRQIMNQVQAIDQAKDYLRKLLDRFNTRIGE